MTFIEKWQLFPLTGTMAAVPCRRRLIVPITEMDSQLALGLKGQGSKKGEGNVKRGSVQSQRVRGGGNTQLSHSRSPKLQKR